MPEEFPKARTETFDHAISGLLSKRRDMLTEAERLRDRIAEIRNDLLVLYRTLKTLGYDSDLESMMPRQKRQVVFGRGELLRAILDVLKDADGPMRSREIAQELIAVRGDDPRDQRYISEMTRRIGKSLKPLLEDDLVRSTKNKLGCVMWRIVESKCQVENTDLHQ